MMTELKSCPLCGREPKLNQDPDNPDYFFICCNHCALLLDGDYEEDEVIEIWGDRSNAKPNWYSVENGLPEECGWYLIAADSPKSKERITTMAFLDFIDQSVEHSWLAHNDENADEWEGVTHWMPLPEVPEVRP